MADPISVISLVEGSIGLALQCGSLVKTLSDMIGKFKHAEVAITSMIQEVETIQFAWNRIKAWSEEHAEAATDSSFVQRLEKSLRCGALVLSALEQDLADYKHTADNASFILRSKMAWNERAFLDHQHRVRGQVQAMTLMLQVSQLSTSEAQTKLLVKKEKALRASDESAYSIVPSTMSSHMSVSVRSRDSVSSIESKELVYYPLSFEDDLFTARVYKRNYRSPWVNTLSKLHRAKNTEERRVLVVDNEPLCSSSSSSSSSSMECLAPQITLPDFGPILPGPAFTTEINVDPTDRPVSIFSSISPTSGKGLSIDSGLQDVATDPSINRLFPAQGQPDILGAIVPASRYIPQIDKSKVAVARPSPAPKAQNNMTSSLLLAVENGNLDDVKTLIHRGAQVNPHNVRDEPPLHLAVRRGHVSMTELLLQEGANCAQEWHGMPPIHIACKDGNFKIMKLLLDAGASTDSLDDRQEQPLHTVVSVDSSRFGGSDPIGLLVSRGADINARTSADKTPLHLSCERTDADHVRSLLVHGANPNSICEGGSTALHVLAETVVPPGYIYDAFPAIVQLLHDHDADFNAKDKLGDTPLHVFAKRSFSGTFFQGAAHVTFFKLLIFYGANMNAQDSVGSTPFHLLATGWAQSSNWEGFEAILLHSIQHGVNLDAQNRAGNTLLHILVTVDPKCEAIIQHLLQYEVNVNVQNEAGDTPLHTLIDQALHRGSGLTESEPIVQLLLLHGANVNTQNTTGDTPLHNLVAKTLYGQPNWTACKAIIQLLLDYKASVDIQDGVGNTPFHILITQTLKSEAIV